MIEDAELHGNFLCQLQKQRKPRTTGAFLTAAGIPSKRCAMGVKRAALGHVVLNVRDLKKSERFYRDILGMAVSGRNRRTKMSFLSFGAEHHDIALMELPRGAKRIAGDGI